MAIVRKVFLAILTFSLPAFIISCGFTTSGVIEQPTHRNGESVLVHKGYSLEYNEETEQAYWVAWELTKPELQGNSKRTNKFLEDPLVISGSATDKDYYKSGFDRGHLAPAADMTWDNIAMKESFYYSNMSPQVPGFNRGIWKKLEGKTRKWAKLYNQIYIVTGPLFLSDYETIGKNNVAIPTHFYKAVLVINDTVQEAVGFIMPNEKSKKSVFHFAASIDSIENISGLDLFPALRDRYEKKIEAQYDLKYWDK